MNLFLSITRFFGKFKNWCKTISIKWHRKNVPLYVVQYVDDFPDEHQPNTLYLIGKLGKEWLAGLGCPCGCGDFIELVLDGHKPKWKLSFSDNGHPSLFPSVYRSIKCKSHFFLESGAILWCR